MTSNSFKKLKNRMSILTMPDIFSGHRAEIFIVLLCLFNTSCYTIYFERDQSKLKTTYFDSWHHGGGIFGLVEFSPPYDPMLFCINDWNAIVIRQTFATAILGSLIPFGIYTPWQLGVRCSSDQGNPKAVNYRVR